MYIRPESPAIIHHRAKEGTGNRSNSVNWQLQWPLLGVTYFSLRASAFTYPIIWVMSGQRKHKASQGTPGSRADGGTRLSSSRAPPQIKEVGDSVAQVLTFDKRNRIIAKCKWTRCQLCSGAGQPHQDQTQVEPDIILFGAPPVLSSQQCELRKIQCLLL